MKGRPEDPAPFYCPRCRGRMYKPSGSLYYWHADSNHPRCTITNIAEASLLAANSDAEGDGKGEAKADAGPAKMKGPAQHNNL